MGALFDSRCIEQLAADWSEGYNWRDSEFVGYNSSDHLCRLGKPGQGNMLPSQSTCFNHRLLVGRDIWDEPMITWIPMTLLRARPKPISSSKTVATTHCIKTNANRSSFGKLLLADQSCLRHVDI